MAARIDPTADATKVWSGVKAQYPAAGDLVNTVRTQLDDLRAFVERHAIVTVPDAEPIIVAPAPDFSQWAAASVWSPGPFESKSLPSYYYVTDAHPSWSAERAEQHLRSLNVATLWSVSVHKAYPGHFLHSCHQRGIERTVRKSTLFAPVSFVEGWAHYCEQMMLDQGFERGNADVKLGQLAEALVRLARTVVGIKLHTEDLSVEQGMRFFRDEAYLEESSARQEAERGTFDPSYVLYALGKQMLLKLRGDCEAAQGGRFGLQRFHDRLLGHGGLPFWMHRELMVGSGTLLE